MNPVVLFALLVNFSPAGEQPGVGKPAGAITGIESPAPPVDLDALNRIWARLKKETGAPADLPPPPLVLDWEVPASAKMGFQYPTEEFPDNRLRISIAPRTADMQPANMTLWGLGHELTHYLFILRENGFDPKRKTYREGPPQHCNE